MTFNVNQVIILVLINYCAGISFGYLLGKISNE